MPANVGEIEFIVKFDTVSQGFQKALSQAINQAGGLGEGSNLQKDLQEIKHDLSSVKYNVLARLGGRFDVSDYNQFLATYRGEINRVTDPKFIEDAIKQFKATPKGRGQTDEQATRQVQGAINKYTQKLLDAGENKYLWQLLRFNFSKFQGGQSLIEGGVGGGIDFLLQLIKEPKDVEPIVKKKLEAKGVKTAPHQIHENIIRALIGTKETEEGRPTPEIRTKKQFMEYLYRTASDLKIKDYVEVINELFKQAYGGLKPQQFNKLSDEAKQLLNTMLEKFRMRGFELPNLILNYLEKQEKIIEPGPPTLVSDPSHIYSHSGIDRISADITAFIKKEKDIENVIESLVDVTEEEKAVLKKELKKFGREYGFRFIVQEELKKHFLEPWQAEREARKTTGFTVVQHSMPGIPVGITEEKIEELKSEESIMLGELKRQLAVLEEIISLAKEIREEGIEEKYSQKIDDLKTEISEYQEKINMKKGG